MKRGAGAGPGLHPDAPAVALDHLLDDRQADPGSRVLALVVQALEHHEDALEVLRLDADAVVAHREFPFRALVGGAHVHGGRGIGLAELQRVADQVLEQLRELSFVAMDRRQLVLRHRRAGVLDRGAQVGERTLKGRLGLDRLEVSVAGYYVRLVVTVLGMTYLDRRSFNVYPRV